MRTIYKFIEKGVSSAKSDGMHTRTSLKIQMYPYNQTSIVAHIIMNPNSPLPAVWEV